jgi:hypothetical protein
VADAHNVARAVRERERVLVREGARERGGEGILTGDAVCGRERRAAEGGGRPAANFEREREWSQREISLPCTLYREEIS